MDEMGKLFGYLNSPYCFTFIELIKLIASVAQSGSVRVNDFSTLPPPPINLVHDQISIYLALFRVELG